MALERTSFLPDKLYFGLECSQMEFGIDVLGEGLSVFCCEKGDLTDIR